MTDLLPVTPKPEFLLGIPIAPQLPTSPDMLPASAFTTVISRLNQLQAENEKLKAALAHKQAGMKLDFLTETGCTGKLNLCCPTCGFDYTHVQGTRSHLKDGDYGLSIIVQGECQHWWEVMLTQHKGNTFVYIKPIEGHELQFSPSFEFSKF